ncbi:MAG: PstS family phosphate ABC transporter substrate-binding protein [Phycisphaerae bacterium]|nr:PstS family phosphate ABC transporter substrate-binding protein [Phycisphaerae bacterium]
MSKHRVSHWATTLSALVVLISAGCGGNQQQKQKQKAVRIDGSSTVAPITMAAAEMYHEKQPRVQVTVGISGSGGGFKKFLEGRADLRTDINDASRPIKPSELELAKKLAVEFVELPIAYDGIAVVVHPSNDFCASLTTEELRRIWEPGSQVNNWKDVRPGFPDLPLKLYAPGTDSGTFDYFVEAITGKEKSCRSDFTPSEDDNVLVQGVAGDHGSLGYFGFSYYESNQDKLKLLAIDNGNGQPVTPSLKTIADGTYAPLSRPLFMYVNVEAGKRPEVRAFMEYIFTNAKSIVEHPRVNYVALSDALYTAIWKRFESGTTGTLFNDPANKNKSLAELYGTGE